MAKLSWSDKAIFGGIIFILFFWITIPYKAIFKRDIQPFWKYTYKVLTSAFSIFIINVLVSNEISQGEENITYGIISVFVLLALAPWIYLFKKNKLIDDNSETVSIKADVDEISEGNFLAVIKNLSTELNEEYTKQYKENLTKKLTDEGEIVSNIEVKYDRSGQKRSRTISQDVKDRVWNRDGGKCVQCGSNQNLEFDHIIPYAKGGANTYRNIQLLCEPCNRSKSDNIG